MSKKVATSGPVPKRQSASAKNRTLEEQPDQIVVSGPVEPPPVGDWHPVAVSWYESLSESGQAKFFEPSDWQTAQLTGETITRMFAEEKVNGALLGNVLKMMGSLGSTEMDRRRMRIEVERRGDTHLASVLSVDEQLKRLVGDA